MRVDLNAKVLTGDLQEVGTIDRVVFDPATGEVTGFVISTGGLLGKSVVVPREELDRATQDGDRLILSVSKDELEKMPSYDPPNYIYPPVGWIAPEAYSYPESVYLWPATTMQPYTVPSASEYTATSATQGGPISVSIGKGSTVQDLDGNDVGTVEDVRLDPDTGSVRGIVVSRSHGFLGVLGGGNTVDIPSSSIDHVEQNVVYLRVNKDQLERAA